MHDWYDDPCAARIASAQRSPQDTPAFLASPRAGGVLSGAVSIHSPILCSAVRIDSRCSSLGLFLPLRLKLFTTLSSLLFYQLTSKVLAGHRTNTCNITRVVRIQVLNVPCLAQSQWLLQHFHYNGPRSSCHLVSQPQAYVVKSING